MKRKIRLGINIDHVATLRNARSREVLAHPDLLRAAKESVRAGADSITFHLREDRRHILDDDVKRLKKFLRVPINFEMAATPEMKAIALRLRPEAVCIVPEKRREVTTEGGLDVVRGGERLAHFVNDLSAAGIRVSLFISPVLRQVAAAFATGAAAIEIHTGSYCDAEGVESRFELKRIKIAAREAAKLGMDVHAGHGLTYENVGAVASIVEISELNIGHFLIGEAVFVGLGEAVKLMRQIIAKKS